MKIAPSILSADFGRLNEEIAEVEPFADLLHVDVMDGHFVPNMTIGPSVLKSIRTKLLIDCHLMISDPLKYAPEFAEYCDMISFHAELYDNKLSQVIRKIKSMGVKVGLALNPDKPVSLVEPYLDAADYILIMSVYAGFPAQKFIPDVLEKIRVLRRSFSKDIEIDGGINPSTARKAADAGASILVAGSSIFGQKDRAQAIKNLRGTR